MDNTIFKRNPIKVDKPEKKKKIIRKIDPLVKTEANTTTLTDVTNVVLPSVSSSLGKGASSVASSLGKGASSVASSLGTAVTDFVRGLDNILNIEDTDSRLSKISKFIGKFFVGAFLIGPGVAVGATYVTFVVGDTVVSVFPWIFRFLNEYYVKKYKFEINETVLYTDPSGNTLKANITSVKSIETKAPYFITPTNVLKEFNINDDLTWITEYEYDILKVDSKELVTAVKTSSLKKIKVPSDTDFISLISQYFGKDEDCLETLIKKDGQDSRKILLEMLKKLDLNTEDEFKKFKIEVIKQLVFKYSLYAVFKKEVLKRLNRKFIAPIKLVEADFVEIINDEEHQKDLEEMRIVYDIYDEV